MVVVESDDAVTVQMGQLSRCLGRQPSTQYLHHAFPPNQLIFAAVTCMPTSALKNYLLLVQQSVQNTLDVINGRFMISTPEIMVATYWVISSLNCSLTRL